MECAKVSSVEPDSSLEVYDFMLNHLEILVKRAKESHDHWRFWAPPAEQQDFSCRMRELELQLPQLVSKKALFIQAKLKEDAKKPPVTLQAYSVPTIKLMPTALPKFTGVKRDFYRWRKEWEALQQQGEPTGSKEVKKFQLLDSLDERVSRALHLSGYTSAEEIFRILENRYGNKASIALEIIEELQSIPPVRGLQPRKIVQLIQAVEKALHDLTELGDVHALKNPLTTHSIEAKLPDMLKREWLQYATDEKNDVDNQNRFDKLLCYLQSQEAIYERLEQLQIDEPHKRENRLEPRHSQTRLNAVEDLGAFNGVGGMSTTLKTKRYLLKLRVKTAEGTVKAHQLVCYGLDHIADVHQHVSAQKLKIIFPDVPLHELQRPKEIQLLISHKEGQLAPQKLRTVGNLVLWDGPLGKTIGGTHPELFEKMSIAAHSSKTHFARSMRTNTIRHSILTCSSPRQMPDALAVTTRETKCGHHYWDYAQPGAKQGASRREMTNKGECGRRLSTQHYGAAPCRPQKGSTAASKAVRLSWGKPAEHRKPLTVNPQTLHNSPGRLKSVTSDVELTQEMGESVNFRKTQSGRREPVRAKVFHQTKSLQTLAVCPASDREPRRKRLSGGLLSLTHVVPGLEDCTLRGSPCTLRSLFTENAILTVGDKDRPDAGNTTKSRQIKRVVRVAVMSQQQRRKGNFLHFFQRILRRSRPVERPSPAKSVLAFLEVYLLVGHACEHLMGRLPKASALLSEEDPLYLAPHPILTPPLLSPLCSPVCSARRISVKKQSSPNFTICHTSSVIDPKVDLLSPPSLLLSSLQTTSQTDSKAWELLNQHMAHGQTSPLPELEQDSVAQR
ncbi:hypothetical protein WMY93_004037 [Mugilogobius chulae]|uniref:Uncharacterized protein n=1 Tax=Mugilogobius chulae TaxID=88201 RepID=A0AAW0PX38_9GOBI